VPKCANGGSPRRRRRRALRVLLPQSRRRADVDAIVCSRKRSGFRSGQDDGGVHQANPQEGGRGELSGGDAGATPRSHNFGTRFITPNNVGWRLTSISATNRDPSSRKRARVLPLGIPGVSVDAHGECQAAASYGQPAARNHPLLEPLRPPRQRFDELCNRSSLA